jgi:tetratricopeptide (TPR) repeat protein
VNIYVGDEHFAKGEYENALDSYNRALHSPSKFKDKILFKLLNKKATALLKLNDYDEALTCFNNSNEVFKNDYAVFGEGCCEHELGFEITDGFKTRLDITKRQMMRQAKILNESGYFAESLSISDFLFKNHFKVDDFYLELLYAHKFAMDKLDMDLSEIESIFNQI